MSSSLLPQPAYAATTEADIQARLLYGAYGRKRLNVLMTFGASALIAALTWSYLPTFALTIWIASIWGGAALGYLELEAFRRAAPGLPQIPRWKAIFLIQAVLAGASWALGPCLMIQGINGALLALISTILIAVCTVATISMVEQRAAMAWFVGVVLAPPAVVMAYGGDSIERLVALALLAGMALQIVVGNFLHLTIRNLIESQGRTRAIIDTALDAIVEIDARGRITDWNRRAENLLGWSREEVLGAGIGDILSAPGIPAGYRQQLEQFIADPAEGAALEKIEMAVIRKDGDVFPAEIAASSQRAGPEWRFTVFIADISERKEAEGALQENREKYRALSEAATEAIFISENGRCLEQNKRAQEIFGYTDAEALGRMGTEWIAPQDRSLVLRNMLSGFEEPYEAMGLRKDGTTFPAVLHGKMMQYKGRAVRVTIMGDLTERKRAEEEQRIAATAFESQQGIMITDAQKVIVRVNHAFTQITGYSAEEVIGQSPRILNSDRHDSAFHAGMNQTLEHEGAWVGEIWSQRKNGEVFPEWLSVSAVKDGEGATTHYVGILTDISERVNSAAKIDMLAFYDPLTQLPNRRLFFERLDQAQHASMRHARHSALLFVDLDNFKTLNDTLGHYQGDLVLVQVAQRLKTCIRDGDTLARFGGDEFVVILENLSEDGLEAATQAEAVGNKILEVFDQDFPLDERVHHGTSSVGITLFGLGESIESGDQPLKRAELAMFQAKASGRNTLRFFDANMQAEVSARSQLEANLREALSKRQFELYFQPQVVGAGRITGVEALLRWHHPLRGTVSPAEFIALAEETGLILPIGQWVLDAACDQLAIWAHDPVLGQLTLSVNVSARQFQHAEFVDKVLATLARSHAAPRLLKLELTESMLVNDVEDVIARMGLLKSKGVGFSLDDFGTGYSSLSYLKRLPLDQLKIDQGFIRNLVTDANDAAIAKMVVALAESMGLAVIAEGVELQAQADFLAHLGCHAYQGYLFSPPVPVDALEALARKCIPCGDAVGVHLDPILKR